MNLIKKFEKLSHLNKKDVAQKLEMTMPTLNSRIEKPWTLTVKDLNNLKELEFNLKTIYINGINKD